MWLSMITNPKVLGALAAAAIIIYYQLSLWSLENTVEKGNIRIEKLEIDLGTAKGNTKKAKAVNEKNKSVIDKCNRGVQALDKSYEDILRSKDKTILTLKKTIADLKKTIIYPEKVIYKECIFEIKSKDDNENNNTFSNLLNIGR